MFHTSERIIISDEVSKSKTKNPLRTIRNSRQRASTWSSPLTNHHDAELGNKHDLTLNDDFKHGDSNSNFGGESRRASFRNRFGIHNHRSSSKDSNKSSQSKRDNNNQHGVPSSPASFSSLRYVSSPPGTPFSTLSVPTPRSKRQNSSSLMGAHNNNIGNSHNESQDPPRSSFDGSIGLTEDAHEPPEVAGVSSDGLKQWLSRSNTNSSEKLCEEIGMDTSTDGLKQNVPHNLTIPTMDDDDPSLLDSDITPRSSRNKTSNFGPLYSNTNTERSAASKSSLFFPVPVPSLSPHDGSDHIGLPSPMQLYHNENTSGGLNSPILYPPNHTNISSGRIGMWTSNGGDEDNGHYEIDNSSRKLHFKSKSLGEGTYTPEQGRDVLNDNFSSSVINNGQSGLTISNSLTQSEDEDRPRIYSSGSEFKSDAGESSFGPGKEKDMESEKSDYHSHRPKQQWSHDFNEDSDYEEVDKFDSTRNSGGKSRRRRRSRRGFSWFSYLPEPNWSRVSSAVVRHAPCFWCSSNEASATDRMILIKLNKLCAIFALAQCSIGVFMMVILLNHDVADRGLITDLYDENGVLIPNRDEEMFESYNNITLPEFEYTGRPEGREASSNRHFYREALTPNLWMTSGSLLYIAVVGMFLFFTMVATVHSIRRVNLKGMLKAMWFLYWILPMQIFFVIALFDFHRVTDVWIKHWWSGRSMAWFRKVMCEPGTENRECAAPLLSDTADEGWCLHYFNSTGCQEIRKSATDRMSAYSYIFFYINASCDLFLVLLLLLVLILLERIISEPVVKSSKESNIPLWLTLPITAGFLGGSVFLYSPQSFLGNSSDSNLYWIGVCYMVSAATFTVSALLGWFIAAKTVLNIGDKTQKQIAVFLFIGMMTLTIFAVATILIYSLVYSINIVDFPFQDDERGKVACYVDAANSCTNCNFTNVNTTTFSNDTIFDESDRLCPEWSYDDVSRIILTQMKQSGTLAGIFIIYACTALRFGFTLKNLVSAYEIDYV